MSQQMMKTATVRWTAIVACLVLFVTACSSGESVPDPQPMPQGMSFSGMWYSPQFEHLYLRQDGDRVEGVYGHRRGGTLEGRVEGNLLLFSWDEPGDRTAAVRGASGQGYFQLRFDGQEPELVGQWGYEEARVGGGQWTAELIREVRDSDPSTIEEFFRVH